MSSRYAIQDASNLNPAQHALREEQKIRLETAGTSSFNVNTSYTARYARSRTNAGKKNGTLHSMQISRDLNPQKHSNAFKRSCSLTVASAAHSAMGPRSTWSKTSAGRTLLSAKSSLPLRSDAKESARPIESPPGATAYCTQALAHVSDGEAQGMHHSSGRASDSLLSCACTKIVRRLTYARGAVCSKGHTVLQLRPCHVLGNIIARHEHGQSCRSCASSHTTAVRGYTTVVMMPCQACRNVQRLFKFISRDLHLPPVKLSGLVHD